MFKNFWLVIMVCFLSACNDGQSTVGFGSSLNVSSVDISPLNGKDGINGLSYVSLITPIVCKDGQNGFKYQTGIDDNPKNGKLDSAEVSSSAPVCPPPVSIGLIQKLSYIKPSKSVCGGDPRGGMLLQTWKDKNGDGELDGSEVILNNVQWCNGQNGAKGDIGVQGQKGANGKNGLTPIFKTEKFYNSEGQSCSRLSIGYDNVYKNGILDDKEIVVSNTNCNDSDTNTKNIGLIFSHTFGVILKNPKHFKFVVTKTNPVEEFYLENPSISGIKYIRITGIFNRPRPDGLVTIHFMKSQLQCFIGDQNPRHIGKDEYTVRCAAYGAYIPANEKVKAVWQIGPRRNSFELKKVEVFGRIPVVEEE